MPPSPKTSTPTTGKWAVVGLLWFCGFFNYADRQAVFSVFPLLGEEFGLSNAHKGMIGSSFMVVYALSAPLAGYLVDLAPRRRLIAIGLGLWSVVCAATGLARRFWHLLAFRAAEGLGESFYFPASMSLLADYHGPRTRSRAMSVHQTSVYAGTAFGGILAGFLGERYGWRTPFWVLGIIGLFYAAWLPRLLAEPKRGRADSGALDETSGLAVEIDLTVHEATPRLGRNLAEILRAPAAGLLLAVFAGANFVAMALLSWLPDFVHTEHGLDLTGSAFVATFFMPTANLVGALIGGALADRASHRPGGRIAVQASGLLLGAPCVFVVGATHSLTWLVAGLIGIGLCKGIYDANIFAAIYDVVPPRVRGTAAGLMNTVGWTGGSLAPIAIGLAGDRYGLNPAIASTAAVYVASGLLALLAAGLARRGAKVEMGRC